MLLYQSTRLYTEVAPFKLRFLCETICFIFQSTVLRKTGYRYRRNVVSFPVCVYVRVCMSNEREDLTVTVELVSSFPFHLSMEDHGQNSCILRCFTLSHALV